MSQGGREREKEKERKTINKLSAVSLVEGVSREVSGEVTDSILLFL